MVDLRDRITCQHTHRILIEEMQPIAKQDFRPLLRADVGGKDVSQDVPASEPLNPLFREAACLAAAVQKGCT